MKIFLVPAAYNPSSSKYRDLMFDSTFLSSLYETSVLIPGVVDLPSSKLVKIDNL